MRGFRPDEEFGFSPEKCALLITVDVLAGDLDHPSILNASGGPTTAASVASQRLIDQVLTGFPFEKLNGWRFAYRPCSIARRTRRTASPTGSCSHTRMVVQPSARSLWSVSRSRA
jgi:hypothetical protein